jgi:hypothetical protein
MAGMGPPPKPAGQRARRNATVPTTALPAGGYDGPIPRWPLPTDVRLAAAVKVAAAAVRDAERALADTDAPEYHAAARRRLPKLRAGLIEARERRAAAGKHERDIWRELWRTPQAHAWARLGWTREVAQYARHKAAAELGDLDSAKEARQHADRLGLSPLAMLRLRWEIAGDELADRRTTPASSPAAAGPAAPSSRYADLRVMPGGADAVAGT